MNAHVSAHAAVWFEIPVTDMERARAFYGAVLQNELSLNEDGPNPMGMFVAGIGTRSPATSIQASPRLLEQARPSIFPWLRRSKRQWSA
jgi:predicted enzyme related to lactoylglutathione lyase